MLKFFISITVWMFLAVGFLNIAHAANSAVTVSPTSDDVYEINNATPGTSKTFLGTRIQGTLITGATTYGASDNYPNAATCGAAGNQTAYATPTTSAFLITSSALHGASYCLGDGVPGQRLTLVGVSISATNTAFVITPKTKAGFSNIAVDTTKDSVTLRFNDATTGWVVVGNAGATIN